MFTSDYSYCYSFEFTPISWHQQLITINCDFKYILLFTQRTPNCLYYLLSEISEKRRDRESFYMVYSTRLVVVLSNLMCLKETLSGGSAYRTWTLDIWHGQMSYYWKKMFNAVLFSTSVHGPSARFSIISARLLSMSPARRTMGSIFRSISLVILTRLLCLRGNNY